MIFIAFGIYYTHCVSFHKLFVVNIKSSGSETPHRDMVVAPSGPKSAGTRWDMQILKPPIHLDHAELSCKWMVSNGREIVFQMMR